MKRLFPTRKKKTTTSTRPKRHVSAATFIQRSRNESSEQKAIWHQVTGAGRSHVRRQFFGLTEDEQTAARNALEALITKRVLEMGR